MCLGVVSEALTVGKTASHHAAKLCLRHHGRRCESLLGELRRHQGVMVRLTGVECKQYPDFNAGLAIYSLWV